MRAIAVFPAERKVEIVDHQEPRLGSSTDVKLRMLEAGVCGTDREICAFEYGSPPFRSPYLVIGHESLGEVIEVGSGVTRVKEGDLVIPMVRRPCIYDHCLACRADRQDFCYTGHFNERGIKGLHGFMTEVVVDDQKYMNVVPAALRDVAILVEPLTIAEKAIAQVWQVQQRLPWACPMVAGKNGGHCHSAVVLGAGPVGLLGAMALVANDFETYVYSRELPPNPKADLVEAIGAHYVSAQTHSPQQLAETVGNIDVIYEATGASSVSFEMMKLIGKNGIFVFTGVPGRKAAIEVDTDLIMRNLVLNNQVVFGTVNANRDAFEAAVRDLEAFMSRWPDAVRSLISGRYPISAYERLLTGPPEGIKNVIALGS